MKRSLIGIFLMLGIYVLAYCSSAYAAPDAPQIDARSAVLIDAASGRILLDQNAHQSWPMASTTKIMTALLLLETFEPDDILWIPFEARGIEGSKLYLEPGERYSAHDLLHALMIESGNDAAIAIAVNVAGSIDAFVRQMNEKAQELGLKNTRFANPHGLDAAGHYASAFDLALLASHAMEDPRFREAVSVTETEIADPIRNSVRTLRSHNLFLVRYPYATGIKTGYTSNAGFSLVGSAQRNGVELIGTILGGNSAEAVAAAMADLMDWGFETFAPRVLVDSDDVLAFTVPADGESSGTSIVQGQVSRSVTALLPRDVEITPEELQLELDGDQVKVIYAGELIDNVPFRPLPLEASGLTAPDKDSVGRLVGEFPNSTVLGLGGLLFGFLVLVSRRRRRRRKRWSYVRGWPER